MADMADMVGVSNRFYFTGAIRKKHRVFLHRAAKVLARDNAKVAKIQGCSFHTDQNFTWTSDGLFQFYLLYTIQGSAACS
jgi:hypothetical protein